MSPMNYYTYLYRDPSRNFEPIYVGKGNRKRAWVHLGRTDKHPFIQRLQKMKREGTEPIIEFLCKDVDEELAHLCEIMAIEKYGRKDLGKGPLLNLTDGGDGSSGYKHTDEHRLKISTNLRGKKYRFRSDEHRAKLSAANKGKTPGNKGTTHTDEARSKISDIVRTKVKCPHCEKTGASRIMKRWHFDNCKEKNNG